MKKKKIGRPPHTVPYKSKTYYLPEDLVDDVDQYCKTEKFHQGKYIEGCLRRLHARFIKIEYEATLDVRHNEDTKGE